MIPILLSLVWFIAGGFAHIWIEDYTKGSKNYVALYSALALAVVGVILIIVLMNR